MLCKVVRAGARHPSFQEAAEALRDRAAVTIRGRHVTRIAEEVGHELEADRDRQSRQFQDRQLDLAVTTRPALTVVEVDGGAPHPRRRGRARRPRGRPA